MHKPIAVLVSLVVALTTFAGVAAAQRFADPRQTPRSSPDSVAVGWECAVGNLCVWQNTGATSSRCSWFNQDNDWFVTPTVCSWAAAAGVLVKAAYNHGTSPNFTGVILYRDANFNTPIICIPQGWQAQWPEGITVRSHRWTSGPC